ncbi:MAG: TIGR03067 domain-containing protein, partial [Armatimonadetes bacterium]|nr:TIGR03067 domain-containing protein [Armatimonadota bacterium]
MRQVCSLVAVLAVAFVGLNASAGDAKDDLKALQGTWDLVYFERDGKEAKLQPGTKAINTGDKFVVKRGDEVIAAGTFKFDPSKKPNASETTYTEGPNKGKTFKGIYQIDGDTMKFCRAGSTDDERPTEFKTKAASGQFVA